MQEQFIPFLERFDRHLEADDRRFTAMTEAMNTQASATNRISTTMEVQTSMAQAFAKKADALFNKRNAFIIAVIALLGPAAAIYIAIAKP